MNTDGKRHGTRLTSRCWEANDHHSSRTGKRWQFCKHLTWFGPTRGIPLRTYGTISTKPNAGEKNRVAIATMTIATFASSSRAPAFCQSCARASSLMFEATFDGSKRMQWQASFVHENLVDYCEGGRNTQILSGLWQKKFLVPGSWCARHDRSGVVQVLRDTPNYRLKPQIVFLDSHPCPDSRINCRAPGKTCSATAAVNNLACCPHEDGGATRSGEF
jgi:hypothetical protein